MRRRKCNENGALVVGDGKETGICFSFPVGSAGGGGGAVRGTHFSRRKPVSRHCVSGIIICLKIMILKFFLPF